MAIPAPVQDHDFSRKRQVSELGVGTADDKPLAQKR